MNKLVDDYNNTYHCSIGKKPVDANYSALSEKNEPSHKTAKCKVGDRVRITMYKNSKNFSKNFTKIDQEKY